MECGKCHRHIHITSAMKSRARHETVWKVCPYCEYENTITNDDVKESDNKKLSRIRNKRGIKN